MVTPTTGLPLLKEERERRRELEKRQKEQSEKQAPAGTESFQDIITPPKSTLTPFLPPPPVISPSAKNIPGGGGPPTPESELVLDPNLGFITEESLRRRQLSPTERIREAGGDPQLGIQGTLSVEQRQAQDLFTQFQGNIPPEVLAGLSPTQIDLIQALSAGAAGAVPGVIGGAIGGGVLGGGPASIPLAVGGAVLGGLGTFIAGVRSNVSSQLSGQLGGQVTVLERTQQNLRAVVTDINTGGNPVKGVQTFNEIVALARMSNAQVKVDTQTWYAKGTGQDGTALLARYDMFFDQTLPIIERELEQSIANPNPNRLLVEIDEIQ